MEAALESDLLRIKSDNCKDVGFLVTDMGGSEFKVYTPDHETR